MFKNFLFAIFLSTVSSISAVCPPAEDLLPCTCTEADKAIRCEGIRGRFDIKTLFDHVSLFIEEDVVFNKLIISDTSLLEIPAGSIESLKFLGIEIRLNENLEYISPNAFNATTSVTTVLNLGLNYLSNAAPYQRDIFDLVNNFTNVQRVLLQNNRLSSVPDFAFGQLSALKEINLESNLISSIGNFPFLRLSNLNNLKLLTNSLSVDGISKNAFNFEGPGGLLEVDLTFTNVNWLPEDIFKPLLDQAQRISVGGRSCGSSGVCSYRKLHCDQDADWICLYHSEYLAKLNGFYCLEPDYDTLYSYCTQS